MLFGVFGQLVSKGNKHFGVDELVSCTHGPQKKLVPVYRGDVCKA